MSLWNILQNKYVDTNILENSLALSIKAKYMPTPWSYNYSSRGVNAYVWQKAYVRMSY